MRLPIRVLVLLAGVVSEPVSAQCEPFAELAQLTGMDNAAFDSFGVSMGICGDTIIVGAHLNDTKWKDAGTAFVFQRDRGGAGAWGEVAQLFASDAAPGDGFGVSVAISGDTAVVGAPSHDESYTNSGAVYVFERHHGGTDTWGQVAEITPRDPQPGHWFGVVAISGDLLAVGTFSDDDKGEDAGAVYLFERDEGGPDQWGQVTKLTASDGKAKDWFGAVAVEGDTVIVGANHGYGSFYVFERDHGGADKWGEVVKRQPSDSTLDDGFGRCLSISGDTAIIGAAGNSSQGDHAGAAYIFQRDHGGPDNWGEVARLTASDAAPLDQLGFSVAISGDMAIVGAPYQDEHGPESGAAYFYLRDPGGADRWGEAVKVLPSNDPWYERFGTAAAIDGETTVVGARAEDVNGIGSGNAYVYGIRWHADTYCSPANSNSSGGPATIAACGSTVVDDNSLSLVAEDLPPHQYGYFLASQTQDFIPFAGGSQGNLCLGGTIGRFKDQVQDSGSAGSISIALDLTDFPPPLPPVVLPGETWNFQAWFRDKNPDATSNFTDAVAVAFS